MTQENLEWLKRMKDTYLSKQALTLFARTAYHREGV